MKIDACSTRSVVVRLWVYIVFTFSFASITHLIFWIAFSLMLLLNRINDLIFPQIFTWKIVFIFLCLFWKKNDCLIIIILYCCLWEVTALEWPFEVERDSGRDGTTPRHWSCPLCSGACLRLGSHTGHSSCPFRWATGLTLLTNTELLVISKSPGDAYRLLFHHTACCHKMNYFHLLQFDAAPVSQCL